MQRADIDLISAFESSLPTLVPRWFRERRV